MAATAAPQLGMLKGFYNKNSAVQHSAVSLCNGILSTAAREVPLSCAPGRALQIGEWGCSHGGNSIGPIMTMCNVLNQRKCPARSINDGKKLQVHISHTDVASNSWTELFECAKQYQQQVHSTCPNLQLTFAGVGSSMYDRNYPDDSLDLGFTFNAMHWLSKRPCHLKHAMSPFSSKATVEERAALSHQAASDLKTFLTLRDDEFRPGGLLVMGYGSIDGPGDGKWTHLFDTPQNVADQMVAEGLLKEEELGSLAPPVYFLDVAAQKQVFESVSHSWELLSFGVTTATNPHSHQHASGALSTEECGKAFSNFIKAAMYPFMESGLKEAGRDADTATQLLDDFFSRLAKAVSGNPVPTGFPTSQVLLRRKEA